MLRERLGVAVLVGLLLAGSVSAGAAAEVSPQQRCQQVKVKAYGKLRACLLVSEAKVRIGKPDKSDKCRTAFSAQLAAADAAAERKGASCRFLDNGDGTVSDLDTGLQWEKKVAGSGCAHCVDDAFSWSTGGAAPNGTAFTAFLLALNTETSVSGHGTATTCFAGHCDWRLPTVEELMAIVSPTLAPSLDPAFGPASTAAYWSRTSNSADPASAWIVDFTQPGTAGTRNKSAADVHVRAVRGGIL